MILSFLELSSLGDFLLVELPCLDLYLLRSISSLTDLPNLSRIGDLLTDGALGREDTALSGRGDLRWLSY